MKKYSGSVKSIIHAASPEGGHIFSSSNSIHSGVALDTFWTMMKTVKKFRKYPVSISTRNCCDFNV